MSRFDDFPYGPLVTAFNTLVGRIALVILASILGCMLGTMTALRSWNGLWEGLTSAGTLSFSSIFYGIGFFALPVLLLFTLGFVLWEWRLRYVLIATLLMWVNIHRTVRWVRFDSPFAAVMQMMQDELFGTVKKKAP